jgi:hypothetical protein
LKLSKRFYTFYAYFNFSSVCHDPQLVRRFLF